MSMYTKVFDTLLIGRVQRPEDVKRFAKALFSRALIFYGVEHKDNRERLTMDACL